MTPTFLSITTPCVFVGEPSVQAALKHTPTLALRLGNPGEGDSQRVLLASPSEAVREQSFQGAIRGPDEGGMNPTIWWRKKLITLLFCSSTVWYLLPVSGL